MIQQSDSAAYPEVSYEQHHSEGTGKIWKVFTLLSVVTVIELIMGYAMTKQAGWVDGASALGLFFKGAIVILSLAKAYYIVRTFMHLGDELKAFRLTIVVTLALFVWFLAAFLWDGNSWKNLKNTRGGSVPDPTKTEQRATH
jgi:cytochrome c oxidase subunit IV